jgi:hypothetical protein
MTLHLHFTLKISADLFGSLELTLSAQPSFENLKNSGSVYRFGYVGEKPSISAEV